MQTTPFHDRLIDLLRWVYQIERDFISSLSAEVRSEQGSFTRWSAKDVIGHIAFWRGRQARALAEAESRTRATAGEDVNELNKQAYEERSRWTWDQVQAEAEQTFQDLLLELEKLTETDLTDPQRYDWRKGQPMVQAVLGNGATHPLFHICEALGKRGEKLKALGLQEQMAERSATLTDSPAARGLAFYDLACFYALNGMKEKAIEKAAEALALRPDLVEWSKQDPDLGAIRGEPEFQAIYEKRAGNPQEG